jgi:hypothetical protein
VVLTNESGDDAQALVLAGALPALLLLALRENAFTLVELREPGFPHHPALVKVRNRRRLRSTVRFRTTAFAACALLKLLFVVIDHLLADSEECSHKPPR